jgi:cytoskeletal protein CcmA (bactofilin family)
MNANKIRQSYFKGFIDISGGGVYLRNDLSMNFFDSTNLSQPKFSIKSDSLQIRDSSGIYYTVPNEKLLFIKDLTQNVETTINDLKNRTQYITSSGTDVSYVNIDNNLIVSGDVSMNGNLYVSSDTSLNNRLFVGGDTSLNRLFVKGDSSFNGNLYVLGDSSFNGNLYVLGDISLNGNIYAHYPNESIPSRAIKNLRNEYGQFELQFPRNDIITFDDEGFETVSYADPSNVEILFSYNSDLSLNGNLYIHGPGKFVLGGDMSLNDNLYVGKNVVMAEDVTINNNLDLSGSLIAHNNVNVYGVINQYTLSLDQGYIVNYATNETTIESLQAQINILQAQLGNVLLILSRNNIQ